MPKKSNDTLLVEIVEVEERRGDGTIKPIEVEALAKNINQFVNRIGKILQETPDQIGKFQLSEFTVNTEISGKGALVILGTGVEVTGKGGLTFKFTRK